MNEIIVRLAEKRDIPEILDMMRLFREGHPSETIPRGGEDIEEAYFGKQPVAELIVAERNDRVIGMVQWHRQYDMFWEVYNGVLEWLFVRPEARGTGIWVSMIAFVCSRVRKSGGTFITGNGTDVTSSLYQRSAIAGPTVTPFHLSAEAFQQFADLTGMFPREAIRNLPSPELNRVAAKPRRQEID